MKPWTREAAETELSCALDAGHLDAALALAAELDRMPPKPIPSLLASALWYAQEGLPVFPLLPGGKRPWHGSHGVTEASADPDQIESWWFREPNSNIGLATGHRVDVIDFDGLQAHRDWSEQYPAWEDAEVQVLGTVSTPRAGGLHVYLAATGAPNKARMVGPFVDYRGLGGYVVAPPSRTEVGSWRWLRPLELGALP